MHETTVRVAEDAVDANQTIGNANRGDFDRADVRTLNLMSAPGAGPSLGPSATYFTACAAATRAIGIRNGEQLT